MERRLALHAERAGVAWYAAGHVLGQGRRIPHTFPRAQSSRTRDQDGFHNLLLHLLALGWPTHYHPGESMPRKKPGWSSGHVGFFLQPILIA